MHNFDINLAQIAWSERLVCTNVEVSMSVSLGRVEAELAEPDQGMSTTLVGLINANIKPPSSLSVDDVFIRAMYIVSDQVNSFGGRFPVDEHQGLTSLLIDSPVLVGHRKDQLPVGRTFHAVTVERNGRPWVKSYFYWLKSSDRAEEFRANLDGGIYRECSLAFTFHLPECSICGKDIRRCQHQPFESYNDGGPTELCHFNYRRIDRVLETSLVYRGAVPDTAVVKDLNEAEPVMVSPSSSLTGLEGDADFLVVPRYDGLAVAASFANNRLTISDLRGETLHRAAEHHVSGLSPKLPMLGMLVGQRGKERCRLSQLQDYLAGRPGPVTRLVLNLYPHQGIVMPPRIGNQSALDVRIFPYRIADRNQLERAAREIMTRDGVEIRPFGRRGLSPRAIASVIWYRPSDHEKNTPEADDITLAWSDQSARMTLRSGPAAGGENRTLTLDLQSFDPTSLNSGRRFLARPAESSTALESAGRVMQGRIRKIRDDGGALLFDTTGDLRGEYYLRPIRLHGRECYLFGRRSERITAGGAR
jgi:hypothetical protein